MEKINYFSRDNLSPAKVVQPNIVKIKGHNFTRVYPSPYSPEADARKHIILLCMYFTLENDVFLLCFTDLKYK